MYNPFNKNISELIYDDLKKLIENNISEGWNIEYKEKFPKDNKKIANSIASFANSEGGWYIVGIKENKNESNPFEIVGFELESNRKPDDKITNIVKDNINPIPYFETKIVEIPENKVVLVVQVFESHDPPYFSKDGVYIRVGGTSKKLDDRYQFEKLLDKKENFRKRVNSFMDNTFCFDDYGEHPYLEFYVYVNNPKNVLFENFFSEDFFTDLKKNFNSNVQLADEAELSASVILDNIYGSVDSYIIRHVYNNDPMYMGLTLELFKQGHLKLIFPFNVYDIISLNKGYECLIYYEELVSEYNDLRIIDLAESMLLFQIILAQYKRLLEKFDCKYELNLKYKFNNFDLITPFMDSGEYMDFILENKIPINLKTSIDIPNNDYFKCQFKDFDPLTFTIQIVEATGLPRCLVEVISNGYARYIGIKSKNKP